MIPIAAGAKIWIATGHTDMRKGMQGLALLVQEGFGRDPFAGCSASIWMGRRGNLDYQSACNTGVNIASRMTLELARLILTTVQCSPEGLVLGAVALIGGHEHGVMLALDFVEPIAKGIEKILVGRAGPSRVKSMQKSLSVTGRSTGDEPGRARKEHSGKIRVSGFVAHPHSCGRRAGGYCFGHERSTDAPPSFYSILNWWRLKNR